MSETYDFTFLGAGSYTFDAHNLLHYMDSVTSAAIPIYAHISQYKAFISRGLRVQARSLATDVPATDPTFIGCDDNQEDYLTYNIVLTSGLLQNALQFVASVPLQYFYY